MNVFSMYNSVLGDGTKFVFIILYILELASERNTKQISFCFHNFSHSVYEKVELMPHFQ